MKGIQMDAFEELLPEPMRPPLAAGEVLGVLKQWADAGWLRHLDHAFAQFLAEVSPDAPAPVLAAAALLVHMEGRGHTCLVVDELVQRGALLLGWPAAPAEAWQHLADRLPARTASWLEALEGCTAVASHGVADAGTPLVLDDGRLYLRRHWLDERQVAAGVTARVRASDPVDEGHARRWLSTLFGPVVPDAPFDWQRFACAVALRSRLSVITGGPGTGKTYTAARLLALIWAMAPQHDHLRIALAAPTGKAAARLRQSIDSALQGLQATVQGDPDHWLPRLPAARTLHGLLGVRPGTRRFIHDAAHPLEVDVLVVDEASMVHLEMMAALLDALPAGARVILLGDKDQLASVEAGAVLGDLCHGAEHGRYDEATCRYADAVTGQAVPREFTGGGHPALAQQTVMLRESRRFGGPIGQLALAVNAGDTARAVALLRGATEGVLAWPGSPSAATAVRLAVDGYRPYTALLRSGPSADGEAAHAEWASAVLAAFDRFRLLCAVHDSDWGVLSLNAAVARALADEGALSARGEWYEGRPVMVTRNLPEAGVYNGDIGIVLRVPSGVASASPWRVYFADGSTVRSVSIGRLADVDTAFAMTVHKSQGSEFAHTVLVLPEAPSRVLTRELVYTGITRAREQFTLVTGRERAFAEALGVKTQRFSGLMDALDRAGSTT